MVEIRITRHQVCLSACKECGNVRAWNRSKVGTGFIHCLVCGKHTQQIDLELGRAFEIPTSDADTEEKVRRYAFPYHRSEQKETEG